MKTLTTACTIESGWCFILSFLTWEKAGAGGNHGLTTTNRLWSLHDYLYRYKDNVVDAWTTSINDRPASIFMDGRYTYMKKRKEKKLGKNILAILLITCLELPLTELVRRLITLNAEHTVIVLINAKKVIEIIRDHIFFIL